MVWRSSREHCTGDKGSKFEFLEKGDDVTPMFEEGDSIVLNRIVSLKEDSGKSAYVRCMTFANICTGTGVMYDMKPEHALKGRGLQETRKEDI